MQSYNKCCAPAQFSYVVKRYRPARILHKSTAGRYRPVSYPDGPISARYRFMQNAYWAYITLSTVVYPKSLDTILLTILVTIKALMGLVGRLSLSVG